MERARQQRLEPGGYEKLKTAIRTLGYVTKLLENDEASIEKLRRLLCQASTEKTDEVLKRAGMELTRRKKTLRQSGIYRTRPQWRRRLIGTPAKFRCDTHT